MREAEVSQGRKKNYYDLLGIPIHSSPQKIKEAYRKLQKIYHPDIAGPKGHDYTLVLNEAYKVLMREDLRREYDVSIGQIRVGSGKGSSLQGYSSWKGPLRPQALFVDENTCIGCAECVHHARNTFVMDEALARARVRVQYGDDDSQIQVSIESCPVNCIHWVDTEELRVLEHLSRPQQKDGHGIYGQGWESPINAFKAAKSFHNQLKKQAKDSIKNARSTEEETPAQAEARINASMKLKMENISRIWSWLKELVG
ncbi:chaperone protein dnaJ C76, chloroplastic-like [Nicotiana sylvestris]|nr:PREDICTED: uncharacterized protein LOC104247753 [Nicotiana sylvestris]